MVQSLDSIEQSAILTCYSDYCTARKLTASQAADELVSLNGNLNKDVVVKALHHGLPKKERQFQTDFIEACLKLLKQNSENVASGYKHPETRLFVMRLLDLGPAKSAQAPSVAMSEPNLAAEIFSNWREHSKKYPDRLETGLFQIFRRYKPVSYSEDKKTDEETYWSKSLNHVVVCELIYFDIEKSQAWMVTSAGDKYSGTFHNDSNHIMFALFQRPYGNASHPNHRLFVMKLQNKQETVLSGLMIKIGDTMFRPIASDTILVRVPKTHQALLSAFEDEVIQTNATHKISDNSILYNYISAPPPDPNYDPKNAGEEWSRVRFVHQFPALAALVENDTFGDLFFREPSRAIGIRSIYQVSSKLKWQVFEQSPSKPESNAAE